MPPYNLTEKELELFKMEAGELLSYMQQLLPTYGCKKVKSGDSFMYATGKIPVLLVAHVDTVHEAPPKEIFYDRALGALWSPDGLGADDRAGVLGILRLLERGYRPHVLFTDGEERGCIGAVEALESLENTGVRYVIELDRRNGGEAVFYGCENTAFKDYVLSFGFKEAEGIYTDISEICPAWNVAGVNLSCGYYNAHTKMEYLKLPELCHTLDVVGRMLENVPARRFRYWSHRSPKTKKVWLHGKQRGSECRTYRTYWWGAVGAAAGEAAGTFEYGGATLRDRSQNNQSREELVVVVVDPGDIASLYGGTPDMWAGWLKAHVDVLESAADDAVWAAIEYSAMYDAPIIREPS